MDANIDPSLVLPIDFLPAAARDLAITSGSSHVASLATQLTQLQQVQLGHQVGDVAAGGNAGTQASNAPGYPTFHTSMTSVKVRKRPGRHWQKTRAGADRILSSTSDEPVVLP